MQFQMVSLFFFVLFFNTAYYDNVWTELGQEQSMAWGFKIKVSRYYWICKQDEATVKNIKKISFFYGLADVNANFSHDVQYDRYDVIDQEEKKI